MDTKFLAGPIKREGDDRAPAGIFRLGSVFGLKRETKMPFVGLSKNTVAVDDPRSRYYNRIVDASKIDNADWKHVETLFGVDVYKWGTCRRAQLSTETRRRLVHLSSCLEEWQYIDVRLYGNV